MDVRRSALLAAIGGSLAVIIFGALMIGTAIFAAKMGRESVIKDIIEMRKAVEQFATPISENTLILMAERTNAQMEREKALQEKEGSARENLLQMWALAKEDRVKAYLKYLGPLPLDGEELPRICVELSWRGEPIVVDRTQELTFEKLGELTSERRVELILLLADLTPEKVEKNIKNFLSKEVTT